MIFFPQDTSAAKKYKVLHIMSYHAPWEWTDDQLNGFKEALKGMNIEYKVYQMDTKRKNSKEWIEKVTRESKELIKSWEPDLVYTNDDNAQKYVVKDFVNTSTPFVFSGVNAEPKVYGFEGSKNVTGILERPHWLETIKLLKQMVPGIKKIGVVSDNTPTFQAIVELMKKDSRQLKEVVDIASWDICDTYKEYKSVIQGYQKNVDAFVLLSAFALKDENDKNVPWQEAYHWTVKNSKLPDCSFWGDRIEHGNLVGIAVSGYQQGLAAGKLAREILEKRKSPGSLAIAPTRKGKPVVNLKRAGLLGIKINSSILLTAKVYKEIKTGLAD
jgi:ABC-type uncharacterized transport system substrate-binding protein